MKEKLAMSQVNIVPSNTLNFTSRRSPVLVRNGAVCSSQPMASAAGLEILQAGGNCVDACIAVAAALTVCEPMSTGIGGDCFCLYYNSDEDHVYGLNGSGKSPQNLSLSSLPSELLNEPTLPQDSCHAVTVPGTVAGWCDTLEVSYFF